MSDIDFSAFDDHPANKVDFSGFDAMVNKPDAPSMTESAARGAADMALFGGVPKLYGAAHEPLGALKQLVNVLSNGQLVDKADKDIAAYENSKGEYKAADEKAFDTNPGSYIGGGLGAGAAMSLASGGLLGAARGGMAAADAVALATKLDKLQKAKGFFDKAEAGAKAGLGYGAIRGAVSGEGRNLPEKGADVALNAGGGLVTGGVTSMGLSALGGAGKAVLGENGVNAYDLGKKGVNLINKAARTLFRDSEIKDGAKDITGKLMTGKGSLRGQLNDNYGAAVDAGKNSYIDRPNTETPIRDLINNSLDPRSPGEAADQNALRTLMNRFFPQSSQAQNYIVSNNALATPGIAPQPDPAASFMNGLKLKRVLNDRGVFGREGSSSDQGEYVAGQATKLVNKALEDTSPGFNKANDDLKVYFEKVLKSLGLKNEQGVVDPLVAERRIRDRLLNYGSEANIGSKTRIDADAAMEALRGINSPLADDISNQLKTRGLNIQTARAAGNESSMVTGGKMWNNLMGLKYQAANGVGMGVNKAGNVINGGVNGVGKALSTASQKLATMPNSELKALAQKMLTHSSQAVQNFGKILNEASQRDDVGKNALIFTLMQNNAYRSIADDIFKNKVNDSDIQNLINSQAEPTPPLK